VTSGANGAVSSIAVDGQANLVWNYLYDGSGNLVTVKINGDPWRVYTYGSAGITEARDGGGRLIEGHSYDASGNAISSTAAADDISNIEYNASGARVPGEMVTRVTYSSGRTTDYFSRFAGGKMRTVEVKGSCACGSDEAVYAYDGKGHVVRQQNASGYIALSTYDVATGNLLSQSAPLRPSACDPAAASDHCRLDPDALAAATLFETPVTLTTTFAYADAHWPDKPTDIAMTSVASGRQRREARSYHPLTGEVANTGIDGWQPGEEPVRSERATATMFYGDALPSPSAGDLDQPPASISPTAPAFDPGGSFNSAWLALPQPIGLPRSIDGPRTDVADVTLFVYYPIDASVPATLRGRLAATKNAAGHVNRFESYDAFGNVLRAVDPNGVATESSFDALGRPATTTIKAVPGCDTTLDPLCATDLTTTRTYFPAGPLQSEQRAGGGITAYTYDVRGRVATISRGPSAADLREQIETSYDSATGLKGLERYLANENGTWTEKRRESFSYDSLGRLTAVTHADGNSIGYSYDPQGRLGSVRDENHTVPNTLYAYDPGGRLVSVTQSLGTAPGGQIVTRYAYDRQGNLTAVTDPNGNVTSYLVDDLAQVVQQTSPVTGVAAYGYDAAGNVVSATDANGATTVRRYDALGRVLSAASTRREPSGQISTETVGWTYDDATAGHFGVGRVAAMNDPAGTTTYAYERRGLLRLESRSFPDSANSYATKFSYDADGNRALVGYPSGQLSVSYAFDYAGRPVGANGLVTAATYLPFGPLSQLQFGNGTVQTLDYDTRYRITANKLTATNVAPPNATIASYVYGYDAVGNVTNLQDVTDSSYHRSFGYDELNRLIRANTGSSLWKTGDYSWDAMGNILSANLSVVIPGGPDNLARTNPKRFQPPSKPRKKGTQVQELGRSMSFSYNGTTPKLAVVTLNDLDRSVSHDTAGNETSYVVARSYSPRNLLATVQDQTDPEELSPHILRYGYDGRGVRVERTETPSNGFGTSVHRFFFYTPELTLLAATRDDGVNVWGGNPPTAFGKNVDYEIVWFGDRPIAQIAPGAAPLYTFADHLGTPLLQTDGTPAVTWRVEYEPFGNIYEVRAGTRADQPLRFPGQELAMTFEGPEENFNIFRWYKGGWGRYTQPDPIGLESETNLYAYALSNPLLATDPLGLAAKVCCRLLAQWLAGSTLRQRHCYVIAGDGTRYGLYPEQRNGKTVGVARMNDPRDKGGTCKDCQCPSGDQCFKNAFNSYPVGDYRYLGPNSNTFAGTLAKKCCKGGIPKGLGSAPGIDDDPPK